MPITTYEYIHLAGVTIPITWILCGKIQVRHATPYMYHKLI